MNRRFIILLMSALVFTALLSTKCQKEDDPLPFAVVNIRIEPNSTLYINLNTVGGHEYITANSPSRGIIVYRISVNDFVAFERTCPHDPDACCTETSCSRLVVEDDGIIITDPCCESTYLILDGSNVAGVSVKPLKQYNTSYDGKILHIYN
jgi:nitrite reductase/ring-hydroxylating ferredoxin subunit